MKSKLKNTNLYNDIVEFSKQNRNPSIWAIQTIFNLDYFTAADFRSRLVKDGFATLLGDEAAKRNSSNVCAMVLTEKCVIKISFTERI